MAAPRKLAPYENAEQFQDGIRRAGGIGALARDLGVSQETVRRWYQDFGVPLPGRPQQSTGKHSVFGKIADMLERSGIDPDEVGKVKQIRLNEWQAMSKDDDGNAVVTDLEGAAIVLEPKWAEGPAWPVVQPAPKVAIRPAKPKTRIPMIGWKRAIALPDPQIGFRRDLITGEMRPFHDDVAITIAMQAIADFQPDLIVNLGDVVDLAEFGRFEQEPGFALTTQATIDRAGEYMAQQRATAPRAEIRYLEGNHDRRLSTSIIANAKAAFGLKKAGSEPASWPVLSIPNLLRLDELHVEYIGGYPAGITWVNERLACIHGHRVKSNGSTAAAVINDERMSVIFGHCHRIEQQYKTRRVHGGGRTNLAISPGCLCLTDGSVPSTKSGVDPMGRPTAAVEDWQNGFASVIYREGDEKFRVDVHPIFDGEALFYGQMLAA